MILGIEWKMFLLLSLIFILTLLITSRKCLEEQRKIKEYEKHIDKEEHD